MTFRRTGRFYIAIPVLFLLCGFLSCSLGGGFVATVSAVPDAQASVSSIHDPEQPQIYSSSPEAEWLIMIFAIYTTATGETEFIELADETYVRGEGPMTIRMRPPGPTEVLAAYLWVPDDQSGDPEYVSAVDYADGMLDVEFSWWLETQALFDQDYFHYGVSSELMEPIDSSGPVLLDFRAQPYFLFEASESIAYEIAVEDGSVRWYAGSDLSSIEESTSHQMTAESGSAAASWYLFKPVDYETLTRVWFVPRLSPFEPPGDYPSDLTGALVLEENSGSDRHHVALAVDSNGYPRVTCDSDGDLVYAWLDEWGWQTRTVAVGAGEYHDIALDSSDAPNIVYSVSGSDEVVFTRWNGVMWAGLENAASPDVVASIGHLESPPAIAVHDDVSHIAFFSMGATDEVGYSVWSGSSWDTALSAQPGGLVSLAVDPWRDAQIGLRTSSWLYSLVYDGTWTVTPVVNASTPPWNEYAQIAVDGSGWPHFCYWDAGADELRYARPTSALSWGIETIQPADGENALGFAIDAEGGSHIVYQDQETGYLTYALYDEPDWFIYPLCQLDRVAGESVALALGPDGEPHVVFCHVNQYTELVLHYVAPRQ